MKFSFLDAATVIRINEDLHGPVRKNSLVKKYRTSFKYVETEELLIKLLNCIFASTCRGFSNIKYSIAVEGSEYEKMVSNLKTYEDVFNVLKDLGYIVCFNIKPKAEDFYIEIEVGWSHTGEDEEYYNESIWGADYMNRISYSFCKYNLHGNVLDYTEVRNAVLKCRKDTDFWKCMILRHVSYRGHQFRNIGITHLSYMEWYSYMPDSVKEDLDKEEFYLDDDRREME